MASCTLQETIATQTTSGSDGLNDRPLLHIPARAAVFLDSVLIGTDLPHRVPGIGMLMCLRRTLLRLDRTCRLLGLDRRLRVIRLNRRLRILLLRQ